MLARLFAVVILLSVAPIASAVAPESPTVLPLIDRYVYGEFAFAQPNLTSLGLAADLYVYRYDVNGKVYDADDLGNAYRASNKYQGETSGAAFLAQVEGATRDSLRSALAASFPGAAISGVVATVDPASLQVASGNPYDPPVKIRLVANVVRTREAVGLGSLSDAAVEAAFASGASVAADFSLRTNDGYHVAYTIAPPPGLAFLPGPDVTAPAVQLTVDNIAGNADTRAVSARLSDPAVTPTTSEDIRSTIVVTMGDIAKGAAGIPIAVTVMAEVRSLDVAARFPSALPASVSLPYVNAEGLRALKASGAIQDADIAKANENLLISVRDDVGRAFGPGVTVTGGLSSDDLSAPASEPYTAEPPLRFNADANTTYTVAGATADDIDLALRIGGKASVDLNLFAANGRATTYAIHPPSIGEFTAADGGTVTANGQTAAFSVPAGAASFPAQLSLRGKHVPEFTAADAAVNVKVDLQDLDVTLGKAMSGDFGNLLMEITVLADLGVIEVPDELKGSLPKKLQLRYLSADAIRLLVDRGYISEEDLVKLEEKLLAQVDEKLGAALGGAIPVEGGLDRATLAASLVSTPISSDKPLVFKATARVSKPLAGGELQPQAAIALYSTSLPLTLPKLEGLDTLYTIVLPRGLAVTDLSASGGDAEQSKAADGRDQITVRPSDSQAQITMGMAVTPTFVMAKFWPIVLLAVILVVLIVGTPIALVMRKKGKAKKPKA